MVTQSKIKNAGRGVFTTVNIPKDTAELSYIGVLSSNFTTDMRSKSIFHLGWIYQMNKPKEFLVDADKFSNSGRFVNGSCPGHR